jgi:hypothetical protein
LVSQFRNSWILLFYSQRGSYASPDHGEFAITFEPELSAQGIALKVAFITFVTAAHLTTLVVLTGKLLFSEALSLVLIEQITQKIKPGMSFNMNPLSHP